MKIKMQTIIAAVSVLTLAGCASQSEKEKQISAQQLVDQELREQAIKIKLAQDELYRAGAINRAVTNSLPLSMQTVSMFV